MSDTDEAARRGLYRGSWFQEAISHHHHRDDDGASCASYVSYAFYDGDGRLRQGSHIYIHAPCPSGFLLCRKNLSGRTRQRPTGVR